MLSGAQQRQGIEPFCILVVKRRVLDAGATNLPSCEQVLMVGKGKGIPEGNQLEEHMLGFVY